MQADNDQSRQMELVEQKIEKLSRECAAMTAAFASARRVRLLLTLAVLVFVCVTCYVFYQFGKDLTSDKNREQLVNLTQERLEKNQDKYMKQVELLVNHTSPVLTEAFQNQASKDTQVFLGLLEKEKQTISDTVPQELETRLKKRYDDALARHDKLFRELFPKASEEQHDRMVQNIQLALDDVMKRHYVGELKSQFATLIDTWERFPHAEDPKRGDKSLEDQFSEELWHFWFIKLGLHQAAMPK